MNWLRPLGLVAAMSLSPAALLAQTSIAMPGMRADPSQPVEITSETLNVNQGSQTAIFSGNVVIIQGDIRIGAQIANVSYSSVTSQITRILLEGGVTFTTPTEAAESDRATYDIGDGALVLEDNVLLTQGGLIMASDRMAADLAAGTAQLDGNVRTRLPGN
ncbi:LptA/OstA family protein [Ketogulonicigenium vulgare]|uniref:Protein-glutamate methylesterase family protein n=1 Tax=Ketogulonicigenium vulgare (strain WSH-001) TaxID=759362 RepID=F9Y5V2_KETVW|nr:LptA/OstA family protein [Ketogulonicigenium vulgare]ADO43762.1 OstA-like protein [Ketogulonicigenium vulgare Y25]AEM42027.1 Protein-glutamate methylesterase family protein [Ketogulonicigenium vulgare WSH-001]ALJ82122.1 protein-glutamate methyltransferase [Ketogulonicigenium vulgare]ANW34745.1 protein-glutamate methyltransferase [Ketogulonicigenium vulgare]AOZ55795.1 OstA-like protein [Ketogulonicigenium vulgare]